MEKEPGKKNLLPVSFYTVIRLVQFITVGVFMYIFLYVFYPRFRVRILLATCFGGDGW